MTGSGLTVASVVARVAHLEAAVSTPHPAIERSTVRVMLTAALLAAGLKRTAIVHALARVSGRFRLDGDRLIEMDGDRPRYSMRNPGKPREAAEWIAEFAAGDGSHMFEQSMGR